MAASLPEFSIQRHVMAMMMSAVMLLFGIIGYQDIGNDRLPNIDFPIISVETSLPGADPEAVDANVTHFIVRAVNTIPGIDQINSSSVPGTSIVTITFDLDKDIDVAFSEVQTKVSQQIGNLPEDAEAPVIDKVEADALPIMWLSVRGDRTLQQLTEIARNTVRPRLEVISGVGEVRLGGSRNRRIRLELDVDRLNRENLTVQDVVQAVDREHVQLPGGFLVGGRTEQLLKLDLEYHDPEALGGLIIGERNGRLVRMRDVADVVDGLTDFRRLARLGGEESVGIGVIKIAGTNTVEIIDEVKRRVDEEIRPSLPPGVMLTITSDESVFINNMIANLERTLLLAVLLAALVMWLFLKNLRSTLIVAASIPVSLMAVVAVMYFFGFTLNSMTMLAILLLIGVVVDDAIVVLENIHRHRETGERNPMVAAVNGSNQVFFAVVASSLALISIFGPVIFMDGIMGRFFESFAVVVVFGIAASTFVALTLIPMLCSRYLHVPERHGRVYWALEHGFRRVDRFYRSILVIALRRPLKVMAGAALIVVPAIFLMWQIDGDFAPEEDEGQFVVNLRAPLGSSIHYTDGKLREVEAVLAEQAEIDTYFAAIGFGQAEANEAVVFVRMKHWDERDASQQEVMARVSERLDDIAGVRAFAATPSLIGGQRGEPLQFFLQGPEVGELSQLARELESRLGEESRLGRVDLDLRLDQPELRFQVDRERAHLLGLQTRDVVRAVNILIGGSDIARYDDDFGAGERFRIRIKGREDQFQRAEDINRIWLRSSNGERVRLDSVGWFEEATGPAVITRFNLQYSAPFYVDPLMPLGEATETVERIAAGLLPAGYSITLAGQAREFARTADAIIFVLVVAMLLVYMVLASQFNSYLQPVIVMLAIPLAGVGALFGLWITGQTLNIFSMIGMVLLMGVVTKNAILLIDLTNQCRRLHGMGIRAALLDACPIRLRPVLMTSLTLILAMLPAALDTGPGSAGNTALAVAIISGMLASTVLTLVVIPCAYQLAESRLERLVQAPSTG
jgi:hydrophobic/amphiphilic exporter-1 (mainly G- bacteria), HAE1 family